VRRREFLVLGCALLAPRYAFPATWVDVSKTCPVCGTSNVFQGIASYGTYVYREPSRFQYVFWPATTDKFLYTCRRCHLTTYMQDFEEVSSDAIEKLARMLEREAGIEGEVVPYFEIPVPIRLGIAERVYEILGRDEAFWSEFHRVEGFHFEQAGMSEAARTARLTALSLTERMLETPPDKAPARKETLVAAAAMRLHTGDADGARAALTQASASALRAENAAFDAFLDELIEAFQTEYPELRLP
jgi:hypothetical protein